MSGSQWFIGRLSMAEHYQGTIWDGDNPIAENVEVWLTRIEQSPEEQTWNGTIHLSEGSTIDSEGTYRLTLEDGRTGNIVVHSVAINRDRPFQVHFRGAGPLE
jgi:hypothetical protein